MCDIVQRRESILDEDDADGELNMAPVPMQIPGIDNSDIEAYFCPTPQCGRRSFPDLICFKKHVVEAHRKEDYPELVSRVARIWGHGVSAVPEGFPASTIEYIEERRKQLARENPSFIVIDSVIESSESGPSPRLRRRGSYEPSAATPIAAGFAENKLSSASRLPQESTVPGKKTSKPPEHQKLLRFPRHDGAKQVIRKHMLEQDKVRKVHYTISRDAQWTGINGT